jgi:hypothetical protein
MDGARKDATLQRARSMIGEIPGRPHDNISGIRNQKAVSLI